MFAVGRTTVEVEPVTTKAPGSILRLVALATVNLKVELSPEAMLVGLAVKLEITGRSPSGGGGVDVTVTETVFVVVPIGFVAVKV